jgi:leader peptidase (prepilin peptidase)/N-methyltransferase
VRVLVAILFGLPFGSFVTVLVHRTPRHEPVGRGRSRCPSCGTTLTWRDNIPLLSYVVLRGRCRHCGAPISPRYPLLELATAGLFVAAVLRIEDVAVAALVAPFLGLLLAVAVVDAGHRIVPNVIVYPSLAVFGVALVGLRVAGRDVDLAGGAIGLAAFGGGLLLLALIRPGGMGMGDVKLAALIGLVVGALGLRILAVAAGLGILAGGVGGTVALLAGRSRKSALPFGPFLAAGAGVAVLYGAEIADAYLGLLGTLGLNA